MSSMTTKFLGREVICIERDGEWYMADEWPSIPAVLIWATDGRDIWLLESTGTPFPKQATSIRYWTWVAIPKLPSGASPMRVEA